MSDTLDFDTIVGAFQNEYSRRHRRQVHDQLRIVRIGEQMEITVIRERNQRTAIARPPARDDRVLRV